MPSSTDRYAIFVDAGYLLAEGGALCCGTKRRAELEFRHEAFIPALVDLVDADSGLTALRTYWYDASPGGVALSDEHLAIGELANVKLRLGYLVKGRQKGVDSLVLRDLMTLARERAIVTAYILGGDEDLREGIAAVQDIGLRVTLLGVPSATERPNQAESLVRECDAHLLLDQAFLGPHFAVVDRTPVPETAVDPAEARRLGAEAALAYAETATIDDLAGLLERYPRIPQKLDVPLLKAAEKQFGPLQQRLDVKIELRPAFWDTIRGATAAASGAAADGAEPPPAEPALTLEEDR